MRIGILVAGFAVVVAGSVGVQDSSAAEQTLVDTVAAFNTEAARDSIGKNEPPLTEDEVIAALRGWIRKRHPVTDPVFKTFQTVADTRRLPEGAKLTFTTSWSGYNDFHFDVWWVDLTIPTGEGTGYTYRIRDRKIRSRPLTLQEREQLPQRSPAPEAGASSRGANREAVLQTLEVLLRQLAALRKDLGMPEDDRLTAASKASRRDRRLEVPFTTCLWKDALPWFAGRPGDD